MTPKDLINHARAALGSMCLGVQTKGDEVEVLVPRRLIVGAMERLRDAPSLEMQQLIDVCGVDYPGRSMRFDVVYQLLSLTKNVRLRVIVETDEELSVPSIVSIYPSAGWFEREVFDLYGLPFDGHPDLRRILTDYNFEGYPLRRDFPLTGFTQKRYDDLNRQVVDEPVDLQQDYRSYQNSSPWQGLTDVQKHTREEDL